MATGLGRMISVARLFNHKIWTSFTFRLSVLGAGMLTIMTLIFSALGYWVMVKLPTDQVQHYVAQQSLAFNTLAGPGTSREVLVAALQERALQPSGRQFYYFIINESDNFADGNVPLGSRSFDRKLWQRIEFEGAQGEHTGLFRHIELLDGTRLLVGQAIEDLDEREEFFSEILAAFIISSIIVGLFGGIILSVAVGRQIDLISQSAREVMDGNLDSRLPVRGSRDDLNRLAILLNTMLDRIQELIGSVSRVSDHIAHEMRTPLARVQADLEQLRSSLRNGDDRKSEDNLRRIEQEIEAMQRGFNAMLRIARLEAGLEAARFKPLDLETVVRDAMEAYAPTADEHAMPINLTVHGHAIQVGGDPDLLFQAVCNLLDNAIKFGAEGEVIDVALTYRRDRCEIAVSNHGKALSGSIRARLGERFYRPVRDANPTVSNGLGLALVRTIASLHAGALHFPDNKDGFTVILEIKA